MEECDSATQVLQLIDRVWAIFPMIFHYYLGLLFGNDLLYDLFEETNNTAFRHISWFNHPRWFNLCF